MGTQVKLKNVRLMYARALFTPQAGGKDSEGPPKYNTTVAFKPEHPQVAEIKAAIQKEAQAEWKENAAAVYRSLAAAGKVCLKSGDEKLTREGAPKPEYAGMMVISANNALPPLVLDGNLTKITDASYGRPYAGCFVNVHLNIKAYNFTDKKGTLLRGIKAELLGVQFCGDGERLAGGTVSAENDFEAIPEASASPATTASAADIFG